MRLASAANLLAPAWLTIIEKGYDVRKVGEHFVATRGGDTLIAEDTILLLGVIAVGEGRGENWPATDAQITEFMPMDSGWMPGSFDPAFDPE